MKSMLNFMKILHLVQKLLVMDMQADRQHGDVISLTFLFKERRLKIATATCPCKIIFTNFAKHNMVNDLEKK
jgi:hypothetical protein